jgi:hypothetical protein
LPAPAFRATIPTTLFAPKKEHEMFSLRFALLAGLAVGAALLSTAAGVLAAEKESGTIEGKITFDGSPVTKGKVSFHPEKGKPVSADLQADGSYSAKGVPVGQMRITVESKETPKKFANPNTSGLTVEVKKGKQVYDIALSK